VAAHKQEAHHAAPRCLISLHEKANGTELDGEGIEAWLEWEWEAMRWPFTLIRGFRRPPNKIS
jgi:hypothetical protein